MEKSINGKGFEIRRNFSWKFDMLENSSNNGSIRRIFLRNYEKHMLLTMPKL